MDRERNLICAMSLLVWGAVLLALSSVPFAIKCIAYIAVTGLILFHTHRKQLTYEMTFAILAVSALLFLTDPQYLPQTIFLAFALLMLLTLCLFVPIETLFLVLVFGLAMTYSICLLLAVAVRTDPAFTGLLLLALAVFWMVFLRPRGANDLYA